MRPARSATPIFRPEGGALHCRKIASGLAKWLRANGANVYEHSKVIEIDAEAGHIVLESGETMQADRIVVTAGAWVLKLFPELDGELKTYRTALAYVEPPADLKAAWAGSTGHPRYRRHGRRLRDPALRRRRHEIRLRAAQGADQRRRLEP